MDMTISSSSLLARGKHVVQGLAFEQPQMYPELYPLTEIAEFFLSFLTITWRWIPETKIKVSRNGKI